MGSESLSGRWCLGTTPLLLWIYSLTGQQERVFVKRECLLSKIGCCGKTRNFHLDESSNDEGVRRLPLLWVFVSSGG